MPLLDLTRQIKNTGNVVFDGVGSNKLEWIYDADISGSMGSNDFLESNSRVSCHMPSHGLQAAFDDTDEVIQISFAGGSYVDFPGLTYEVYAITDDNNIVLMGAGEASSAPYGIAWSSDFDNEGANQVWKYERGASRLDISNNSGSVFYVDTLTGRTYIGGSLDIAGSTAIIDAGEVQLEDAILDLNFASGVAGSFGNGEQAGLQIGDSSQSSTNYPTWLFNKVGDAVASSYWAASFKGVTSNLHVREIVASGIDADGNLNVQANTTLQGTADVAGNFSVATNKFTVANGTGNTAVAGTLGVTGNVTAAGTMDIGDVGNTTGVAIDAVGNMDVDVGFTLAASTKQIGIQETAVNSTLTNNHTSLVTAGAVVHHVNEAMKKVISYVGGLNHHAHHTINTPIANAQVVM